MISWIYLVCYIVFAVSGSTLIKLGSSSTVKAFFTVPFVNMNVSLISLIGFIAYGLSFIFYTILLSKFELSFISPLTVGLVYILLMITAFVFFKEEITSIKLLGSALILIGVMLIVIKK